MFCESLSLTTFFMSGSRDLLHGNDNNNFVEVIYFNNYWGDNRLHIQVHQIKSFFLVRGENRNMDMLARLSFLYGRQSNLLAW